MNICIVAESFFESVCGLARQAASGETFIDLYLFRFWGIHELSGVSFRGRFPGLGIRKIGSKDSINLYCYFRDNKNVRIFALVFLPPRFKYFNNALMRFYSFLIKKKNYKVINTVGQSELLAVIHECINREKIIHTLHEIKKHLTGDTIKNALTKGLIEKQLPIIVHSHNTMNLISEIREYRANRIHMIPFSLFDIYSSFTERKINLPEEPIILVFGYIVEYKGFDLILKALNITRCSGFRVLIFGHGSVPELKDLRKDRRCIILNRFATNAETVYVFKRASVVLCPYKSCSQSGIVATANYFKKPVFATKVGGFSEVIQDGVNGVFIENEYDIAQVFQDLVELRFQQKYRFSFDYLNRWPEIADTYKRVLKHEIVDKF